jgi:hypothetical protein
MGDRGHCVPAEPGPPPGWAGPQQSCLPPPHVEVLPPEPIVVKAPPQKIVIETPASPPAAPQAAPQAVPPAAQPQAAAPQAVPPMAYPQQAMPMSFGMPMASPLGMAAVTAVSAPRTRLAFTFDTIRIPIPCIKAIAVPGDQEVTVRIPSSQAMPMMAPQMAFPAMPMQAMPISMPMAAMPAQAAGFVCPPCPQPGATAAAASAVTPERVAEFARKIQELEQQLKAAQAQASRECPDNK